MPSARNTTQRCWMQREAEALGGRARRDGKILNAASTCEFAELGRSVLRPYMFANDASDRRGV
jgi:hypothetical protein